MAPLVGRWPAFLVLPSALAAVPLVAAAAAAAPYPVATGAVGPAFDGIGAISGGGATSRLLFSYPPAQTDAILDYLFTPGYGASLHMLKVEIGSDSQSSEGTEPSHMHSPGDLNYGRGYEWRLMAEARARNPGIRLAGLAWGFPGWIGGGTNSPWAHPDLTVGYMVNWLRGARDAHNLTVDLLHSGKNERGWNATFVKMLRVAMDDAGFASTRIVCGDDSTTFGCAPDVLADAVLAAAVGVLGSHGPIGTDPAAVATGKPLWNTEVHVTDPGGTDLASFFHQAYIAQNLTGFQIWNAVTAYYEGLFSWDWGLFRAAQPWSGNYELCGKVWVLAHITQNVQPGWRFLQPGSGAGALTGGGTYVTFVDPPSGGLTIVVNKPAGATAEVATFQLTGPAAEGITSLRVWHSAVASGASGANLTGYYNALPPVALQGGSFSVALQPGDLFTFTTVATGSKGAAAPPPPPAPFPTAYADDFDGCVPPAEAPYWTDQTGSWECVATAGPRGTVMQQVAPMAPLSFRSDEQRPLSILGDVTWTDADVSIDALMPASGDAAMVGVRANPNCCGRAIVGENLMPGVWLAVTAGSTAFHVYNAIQNASAPANAVLNGTLPAAPQPGAWVSLRLAVAGGVAAGFVDGVPVFAGLDVQPWAPATGFVGIATGSWGQFVAFDNFTVAAGTGGAVGRG